VTDSNKHSSLLQSGIHYARKSFITETPGQNVMKLFTAVIY